MSLTQNATMLFVDASTNRVAVGTNAPVGLGLTVNGGTSAGTYFYGGTNNRRQLSFTSFDTASLDAGHEITASSVSGRLLLSAASVNHIQLDAVSNTTVFNEGGTDQDFRVESDSNANMLFVDGGANRVGIGTSPATVLDVYSTSADADGILRVYLNTATSQPTMQIRQRGEGGSSNTNQGLLIDIAGNNSGEGYILNTSVTNSNINGGVAISPFSVKGIGTFQFRQGGVINENGADSDFRVESDSQSHMFFVDAGNGVVGIKNDSPASAATHLSIGADTISTQKATVSIADSNPSLHMRGGSPLIYFDVTGGGVGTICTDGTAMYLQDGNIDARGDITHVFGSANSGTTVINESSQDIDFRVESDNDANMLFVDAGNDRIGIMESSPTHTVHQTSETGRRLGQVTEWSGTMFDITNNQGRTVTLTGLNNYQAGMVEVWFSWRANGGSEPATSRALYAFYEGNNSVSDITEMEFSGKNIVSGDVVVTGGTDSLIITVTNTDWFGSGLTGTSGYYYVKAFGGAAAAALSK